MKVSIMNDWVLNNAIVREIINDEFAEVKLRQGVVTG